MIPSKYTEKPIKNYLEKLFTMISQVKCLQ